MWATVELTDDILQFINDTKDYNETYDEIKELVFTQKRLNKECSMAEMFNLALQFKEIKNSAIKKVLNKQELNFPEGFLIERLLSKYSNEKLLTVEEHFKQINLNCSTDRKTRRENERKTTKLYNQLINKLFKKGDEKFERSK